MKRWGIRSRVLFVAILPAAAIAMVLAAYFIRTQINELEQALSERGQALAHQLAPAAEYGVVMANRDILRSLANAALQEPDVVSVTVTSASGIQLIQVIEPGHRHSTHSGTVYRAPILQSELAVNDFNDAPSARRLAAQPATLGWVNVELSHAQTSAQQERVLINSLLITGLGLIIAALLALRMSRDVIDPIYRLNDAVKELSDGNLDTRIDADSGGELGALEQGVNSMASSLQDMHELMQSKVNAATGELRRTLDNMERQNEELEQARQRALEASRTKSEFMANMSHEIRTPMHGVIGFTNLLARSPLNADQREYVDAIHQSAANLMTVINDILDFTRIASGDLVLDEAEFDLRHVIDDSAAILAASAYDKGLELVVMLYSDVPRFLCGDPARLRQCITNLMGNAIKFTQRGSVIVRVMLEDEDSQIALIKVSVQDTGIGLSLKDQERLFSAFDQADTSATRQFGGIGLGLVICRKLVDYMGGTIGLQSQLGKGSEFWFTFRCRKQHWLPATDPARHLLAGLKCALYDPHDVSRLALTHQLRQCEVEVAAFAEPARLLDWLMPAEDDPPQLDFVVVSLNKEALESDVFGTLMNELRRSAPCPVVALASSLSGSVHAQLSRQGADLVLPKSVAEADLFARLSRLLSNQHGSAAEAPAGDGPGEHPSQCFAGLRILLVDDHAINRKLVAKLYALRGATVVEAENGEVAVRQAANRQFDLILMDIHMPVMSGTEATEAIREMEQHGRHTPIIALTANAMRGERDRLIRCGLDDCLIKPMHEEDLIAITEKWVDADRLEGAAQVTGRRRPIEYVPNSLEANRAVGRANAGTSTNQADRRKALRIAGGNAELADELFDMLLNDLPDMKQQANAAFSNNDITALQAVAHKIHGAALYCAVDELRVAAAEVETAAMTGRLADLPSQVERLNHHIDQLLRTRS
jgi:two-component system sensor histidine kinase BarA